MEIQHGQSIFGLMKIFLPVSSRYVGHTNKNYKIEINKHGFPQNKYINKITHKLIFLAFI